MRRGLHESADAHGRQGRESLPNRDVRAESGNKPTRMERRARFDANGIRSEK
jgi:hypothetical protein